MYSSTRNTLIQSFAPAAFLRAIRTMIGLSRQRSRLGKLDDDRLHDLGISREDAAREANRAPWDVPHYWQR